MDVIESPNPILTQKSEKAKWDDLSLHPLALEMKRLMYKYKGIGLAAPQVGVLKRMIVVDCEYDPDDKKTRNPLILVNPWIVDTKGNLEESSEGCLSCPGISVPVMRYPWVKVKYIDFKGIEHYIEAENLMSHCLQHEIDHLDGKTLFQSCLPEYRIQALKDYEEAKANGAIPGMVG